MAVEDDLTQAFIDGYYIAGREINYWGHRFLQAVRRNGGLETAKRMLLSRTIGQRKGLDAALDAGRPELTVEAIVLQPRFRRLFTEVELETARERLRDYKNEAAARARTRKQLYPDELPLGVVYIEGAKRQVRVNAYERDAKARAACLARYGHECAVCGFNFERRYGVLGKQFIHVHHLHPLSLRNGRYELDPVRDLRPVCPNCHAMLHQEDPPLSIEKLKKLMAETNG